MARLSPGSSASISSGSMNGMTGEVALARARQIADEVLLPSATYVDAADRIPAAHLDALAASGLYGIAGPAAAGGLDADLTTFCNAIEIMAGSCLATTFVWLQHHSAVRALRASANVPLRDAWLEPLCQGAQRAGIALGGVRPGPPLLRARTVTGGYLFNGSAPWVTGWNMIDVVYTLARDEEGSVVAALLPSHAASITARSLDLIAVNASRTVELSFADHFVPAELVTSVVPLSQWQATDAAGLRPNGSLCLGVAARCCIMITGSQSERGQDRDDWPGGALRTELASVRAALDNADVGSMPAARAAAAEFAFRAAGVLVATAGSRSILAAEDPQRLAREALFLLVFGSRPAIKQSLTLRLAASPVLG